jgi:hypothetical protein
MAYLIVEKGIYPARARITKHFYQCNPFPKKQNPAEFQQGLFKLPVYADSI